MFGLKLGFVLFFSGILFLIIHWNYQGDMVKNALACPECLEDYYAAMMLYPVYGFPMFTILGGIVTLIGFIIVFVRITLKKALLVAGLGAMVMVIYNIMV